MVVGTEVHGSISSESRRVEIGGTEYQRGPHWLQTDEATLRLSRRVREPDGYATSERAAEFTLRYLPDTDEIVLLKARDDGDEAVYSELLS